MILESVSCSSLSGIVPTVSLYDVMWGYSDSLAEEILHSSSFLKELWSGHLTQSCYTSFMQQEAVYLQRVSSTLEVRGQHFWIFSSKNRNLGSTDIVMGRHK